MERYEEYKDSGVDWIEEIPAGWETRRIKSSVRRKTEINKPTETVLSLYRDLGVVIKSSREDNFNRTSENTEAYRYVEVGDLVVNKMKTWQGSLAVSEYCGIVSPAYYVFSITDPEIYPRYLHYQLRDKSYLPEYRRLSGGIRPGQWDLGAEDFVNIPMVVPPRQEQIAIALYLDSKTAEIDSLVEDCEREVELLREYRKAVISEAVTKGIDSNAPMKDSGIDWIGEIPEGWQVAQLGRLCETRNGLDYDATQVCGASDEGSVLVIRSGNVSSGQLVLDDCLYIRKEVPDQLLLRKGDVVVVRTNGSKELVGKSALVKTDGVGTLGAFMLLCRSRFGRYINWLLQSTMLTYYMGAFSTSTVNQLSNGVLRRLHVPFPAEAVQEEICNYLDAKTAEIDSLIADYQSMADKLREYRTSLISEAVTGKLKVPGVA